jgi:hypothetical protein
VVLGEDLGLHAHRLRQRALVERTATLVAQLDPEATGAVGDGPGLARRDDGLDVLAIDEPQLGPVIGERQAYRAARRA